MFRRVLVANRGEIARRIIRTLNKLSIESVAIYSEADRHASYLREATKAVCIGGSEARESYLSQEAILEAALQTDSEAVHPGFGFLSENAIFAERCRGQKLSFIGPSPQLISLLGDKAEARKTMKALGVKTLVGSNDVVSNLSDLAILADELKYPILLKARAGGGGKGMRLVHKSSDLETAFAEARMEALSAFSDGEIYVEKFVENARHIEFQILADHYGNVVVLGERDCSIQRKNQKLIEEAPASGFSDNTRRQMSEILSSAMKEIGYTNAGTVEFLQSPDGELYFMEMNTRIQVEHPVTEFIFGIDIVEWQVRIACNQKLPFTSSDLRMNGASIECRLNAENPVENFLPSPGTITRLSWPSHGIEGPVRIDTHVDEGFVISPHYDSMLAKVITHGADRRQAIAHMIKALENIEIAGVKTTIDFLKAIVQTTEFAKGSYDCSFIEKHGPRMLSSLK